MKPVLTKEQAYNLDNYTIDSGHLSQENLMDNAGKVVAQFFCEYIDNSFNKNVVVVCGKGNNGGDGVITHFYLKYYGVSSRIIFAEEKHGHSELLEKYRISKSEYSIYNNKTTFNKYDWIIDGIFGIGLSRSLTKKYLELIDSINKKSNIVSIDIPSGLSTNSFKKNNSFIESTHTITFGYSKLGHYLNCINNLYIKDIGLATVNELSSYHLIDRNDINKILKPSINKKEIHKYDKGELCIVAGSLDFPGAAILAAKSSMKSGAGFVRLHILDRNVDKSSTPEEWNEYTSLLSSLKSMYPDIVINSYMHDILPNNSNNILFGPGINWKISPKYFLEKKYKNIIIDASGFNSFECINDYPENAILTPHIGEFKRIFHLDDKFELNDFLFSQIQKQIKDKIIILKSFNTFIISRDEVYIVDKGSSILAVAGTGDVLSGILISLLSQGYTRLEASILGTYLHAESANYYIRNISKDGLTASNLIDCISHAFNKLRKLKEKNG